ncbi:DUF6778 family protein [Lentibacter sp. XHP0401]|uniref:DUF6778 family protein n=1 Tax=Lentibacter sp. XHP0401 TaxID=2984334 RepID=UPI0021E928DF|nr:DUF6778 family protein [Lentibacter sp. XHP0401]MCV2891503.1 hypothetical protein [Lentibacter sp. XHP0401]
MKLIKATLVAAMALTVSGCASMDVATRNAPFEAVKEQQPLSEIVAVSDVKVSVSRDLRVSEAEVFYPVADIVWRGDERGDRYEQVGAIFNESAKVATQDLKGDVPARIEIDVLRFHSVTDKTRYTVGGTHSISFLLSVKDPESGLDLVAPRKIKSDLHAFGGQEAIAADARGETQKVRVSAHLASVIRQELSTVAAPDAVVSRNRQVDTLTSAPMKSSLTRVY